MVTDCMVDGQGELLAAFVEHLPLLADAVHAHIERVEDQVSAGEHEVGWCGEGVDGP